MYSASSCFAVYKLQLTGGPYFLMKKIDVGEENVIYDLFLSLTTPKCFFVNSNYFA